MQYIYMHVNGYLSGPIITALTRQAALDNKGRGHGGWVW